jgi:tetratricopeptide (TPR) repeat protein
MSRFGNLEFGDGSREREEVRPVPRDEPYYLALAQGAFEAGKFEQALRGFAKVLEFAPRSAAAWTGQVRMLIELGEFQEAKVWADKALALFPNEPELLAAKGVALARLGDFSGAISFSDAAVESRANTPYIWLARGDVLLARKEKRAEFCFEKAFALAANHWFVLWLAGRIHTFYEHFARGLKLVRQALELQPGQAALWIDSGRCELALGLAGQARHSFEQARELDADCALSRDLLADAEQSGWLDKAARRWRQWFQK